MEKMKKIAKKSKKCKMMDDDGLHHPIRIEVIDDAQAEVLKQKTPAQRIAMAGEAWDFARMWISSAIRTQHPDWEESTVKKEVSRRMLNASG